MHILNNKQNKINFGNITPVHKPASMFYNQNAIIPTFIIESGVTALRAHEAYKKGGKIEASERLVEQGTSAVVWLWGVQAIKKIGDIIGAKLLKIKDLNFDVGFDYLRNPLENISKKAMAFKVGNILTSTFLATAFIGFILPKINHKISKKAINEQNKKNSYIKSISLNEYKKKTKSSSNISFTSLLDKSKYLAHVIENDSVKRLLITDSGVVSGRFYNGRNKYEKIENLFRDVSSIYFYLFSTKHIVALLNKLTSNTNISPNVLKPTIEMLGENLEKTEIDKYNFLKNAVANNNAKNLRKIDKLFKEQKTMDVEEFKKIFPDFNLKADSISNLQPELKGKKIITKLQAYDIVSKSWASDEEFLHKLYSCATKGKYNKKEKFISAKETEKIRQSVNEFIMQINKEAQNHEGRIDKTFVEKIANKNIIKNFTYHTVATGISILALGILIPRIQYLIRKKLTNKEDFVGIKEYK